ncbi:hypothetical protein KRX51_03720 [Corynebacterium sp. TAE3-ERU12]|uniref:hypothetical protein n=1 Tax=Corynebacterium sp. TAE3-ERU12 TaxID=2849491 RepID=UPI001C482896|nr:hypothetical protein [Corynebacterium sp. TAE3-ERU12]MBV7295025.1 hypothetical protein [Corynebacterium sp. TAE3-ERU12]
MSTVFRPGVPAADDPVAAAKARAAQFERRPSKQTWLRLVFVAIAIQTVGHIWVLSGRTFYWDDFIIVGSAVEHSMFSPSFWWQPHDGHLAPLAFFLQAAVNAIAPWQWWLPAVIMTLAQIGVGLVAARTIHAIAGRSWQGLIALAFITWTPLVLPGGTWWSAAVNSLPMQLVLFYWVRAAVVFSLRSERQISVAKAAQASGLLIIALLFFEKSLAIVPVSAAMAVSVAYMERRSLAGMFNRGRRLWIPGTIITLVWAVIYGIVAADDARKASGEPRMELVLNGLGQVLAAQAGGPWRWERWAPGQAWADAPAALISTGAILVLLGAAVAMHRDWRAWLPLSFATTYLFAVLIAMTWVRSGEGTANELAKTLHYYGDVAMVTGLGLAAAWSDRVNPLPKRSRYLVLALGAALAASSLVSVHAYRTAWADDVVPSWLATTKKSLADAAPNTPVLNQPVPLEVLLPVVRPMNTYHYVFDDLRDRPPFERYTDRPQMFDASGALIAAEVSAVGTMERGGVPNCGSQMVIEADGTGTMDVPISDIVQIGDWVVEFNATASEPMQVRVAMPNPYQTVAQTYEGSAVVPVGTDLKRQWVAVGGGGNIVRVVVRDATPGATLCVGAGGVGPLVPAGSA